MSSNGKRTITDVGTEMRSYYGRPVIKEPTWTWEIPWYFFFGGMAGAAAAALGGALAAAVLWRRS